MAEQPILEEPRRSRREIAEVILKSIDSIETDWLSRVARDLAPDTDATGLKDGIRDYLHCEATTLREDSDTDLLASGEAAWAQIAREHGITRVQQGFDVIQLVHEFILLRQVIIEHLRRDAALARSSQIDRVVDLVESAIALSMESYVTFRDRMSRRAQAEYIGFVTHELRNPLSAAISANALLERQSNATQGLVLEQAKSLSRMKELIDSVLLSKGESAALKVEPKPIDLATLVYDVIVFARQQAQEKGLRFESDFKPETQITVDPTLTEAALRNLIENAVKYTDRGAVLFKVEEIGSDIVFHVSDSGEGLTAEEVRTIFDPFKRGNSKKPGTGLGLSVSRRAIEAQGGRIGVECGEQGGCHFWFRIPKTVSGRISFAA